MINLKTIIETIKFSLKVNKKIYLLLVFAIILGISFYGLYRNFSSTYTNKDNNKLSIKILKTAYENCIDNNTLSRCIENENNNIILNKELFEYFVTNFYLIETNAIVTSYKIDDEFKDVKLSFYYPTSTNNDLQAICLVNFDTTNYNYQFNESFYWKKI
ncbi:hypothetical protein ASO20_02165 [Mycoplasma sp. (ex Biomphalaria glabrata)]|uniref:hypothetical protein n=1 Tax=Mycoplasma sp. (ex Biomphalaria glabrata) TaxID=1749074 RepID=UPI00073AA355|nr:hypothetical protein [Mycoplasma sp. (ex Biomphalaria glabrata)]ALV23446.1 hypothetical protein ASO20_02165 [Mycoplasma sp. (ex Biomphalaria glabrata)]